MMPCDFTAAIKTELSDEKELPKLHAEGRSKPELENPEPRT